MVTTRQRTQKGANGHANGDVPEKPNGFATGPVGVEKTDYSRWRLLDEDGRHTWHYLTTDKELKAWPQTVADKFHLGLPTVSTVTSQCHLPYPDRFRIFQTSLRQRNRPSPFKTACPSTQNFNFHLETGRASMADRYSCFPAL
jgi:hypothetical protein